MSYKQTKSQECIPTQIVSRISSYMCDKLKFPLSISFFLIEKKKPLNLALINQTIGTRMWKVLISGANTKLTLKILELFKSLVAPINLIRLLFLSNGVFTRFNYNIVTSFWLKPNSISTFLRILSRSLFL